MICMLVYLERLTFIQLPLQPYIFTNIKRFLHQYIVKFGGSGKGIGSLNFLLANLVCRRKHAQGIRLSRKDLKTHSTFELLYYEHEDQS